MILRNMEAVCLDPWLFLISSDSPSAVFCQAEDSSGFRSLFFALALALIKASSSHQS